MLLAFVPSFPITLLLIFNITVSMTFWNSNFSWWVHWPNKINKGLYWKRMHTALDYIKFIAFYSFLPLFRMSCQLQNFINGFLVFYKKRDVRCKRHDTKRYHTVNYSWTVYSHVHGVKWFMLYCFHTQVICFWKPAITV